MIKKSISASALLILVLLTLVPMNVLPLIVQASGGGYINGRVTVFSNMVIQNPITSISKTIAHPADVDSSVLHVQGQSNGDPSQRQLTVSVNGQTRINQYVSGSFDILDVETGIVNEGQLNTITIDLDTTSGSWNIQCFYEVSTLGADVYIIMIPGVTKWWVTDMYAVARGVASSCMVRPLVHLEPWQPLTYLEITDMASYQSIIENPDQAKPSGLRGETGIIVVNAHGEVLPLPSAYTWSTWTDVISSKIQTGGLTWAQVAGWPFYYWSYDTGQMGTIGSAGFKKFMEPLAGTSNNINCYPAIEGQEVDLGQEYGSRLSGYGLVAKGLTEGRPIDIGMSYPADRDAWTESLTCSDGSWSPETVITIEVDTSIHTKGTASIKGTPIGMGPLPGIMAFTWDTGKEPNANEHPVICFDVYLDHAINGGPPGFTMNLFDAQNRMARSINYGGDDLPHQQWITIAIRREEWDLVDSGFDWSSIKKMWIICSSTYSTYWFDHIYFDTGASTICHNFDVMYRLMGSANYLTLGLIGFGRPNQRIESGQQVGYYVHNGAGSSDSDYNKGKYTMAVAAWTKISLLASAQVEIVHENAAPPQSVGTVTCKLLWSKAISSGNKWIISFVTETVSCVKFHEELNDFDLADALAPLKVFDPAYPPPSTQSPCSFDFITSGSRKVSTKSHTSWEHIIAEAAAWTAINVVLAYLTFGASLPETIALTLAMGGLQTYTDLVIAANESPNPIYGPNYVDLAMHDNSNLDMTDPSGEKYRQLQSYGLVQVGLPKLGNGGADYSVSFKFGQRVKYAAYLAHCWYSGQDTMTKRIIVEPRSLGDANTDPLPTQPSGETQPFANEQYDYSARTTDPDGDDIRYKFLWSDGTPPTITDWHESGNTVTVPHTWTSFGSHSVTVYVQDSQRAYNPNDWITSNPVPVQVLTKLIISTSIGGTTNPSPGTHGYTLNTQLNVYATASPGYLLDYWKLDGFQQDGNPLQVTMDQNHMLEAYFLELHPPAITIIHPSILDTTLKHEGNPNGNDCNMQVNLNGQGSGGSIDAYGTVSIRYWGNIWARPGLPGNIMFAVVGIENTPLDTTSGMSPGIYPGQNYDKTYTFNMPYSHGTYAVYGIAAAVYTSNQAKQRYIDYPNNRFLVGMLQVDNANSIIFLHNSALTVSAEIYPQQGFLLSPQTINGQTYYASAYIEDTSGNPVLTTKGMTGAGDTGGIFTCNYDLSQVQLNNYYFVHVHADSTNGQSNMAITCIRYYNNVPYTPSTPTGSMSGSIYTYTLSTRSSDPDGDNIYYQFDWGDGSPWTTIGPYSSGTLASTSHTWSSMTTYTVRVRTGDTMDAWSDWSITQITIHQPTLTISTSGSGSTSPAPGIHTYNYGASVTVTAYPSTNYYFDHWILDGTHYYGSSITVQMTADHSLTAYFYYGGGGGCPYLYVYDGENFVCEGLLNIHNPEGNDVIVQHTLMTQPARINGTMLYDFRLVEHPQTISHIDQVKLYVVLENGRTFRLPLIWAMHSEYGNVKPQLRLSDEWKTVAYGADHNNGASQYIQLKFLALPPFFKVKAFIFQIEGNNIVFKR